MESQLKTVLKSPDIQFAMALLSIIFMMFIPLPPPILDFLLTVSITISFLSLMIAVYIKEPLEFSTFPTFLLISTLFRLSLNIATTRNILLGGAHGNVSKVVTAFGNFVVGGNYFVGFVIFLILVLINFMVITKGAGRVAEVSARFTLDAMPGKQMAIDADLNAGVIDRDESKKRRKKIEKEADFYGSMDGASKFVRGDAIAGLVITVVNIVVGLGLGVLQHKMSFTEAAQVYTLLTIGDGLVSQIPAIIISVAAGIVVTRAGSDVGLSQEISHQMFLHSKALYLCSALLLFMGLIPGLPFFAFFMMSVGVGILGRLSQQNNEKKARELKLKSDDKLRAEKAKDDTIENLLHVDTLCLEVGVAVIPLVDRDQNGEILERIVSSRKQFAQDMGIIVPMVMVRDNIQLKPGEYQVLLKGNVVAKGMLLVDHELAMAPEEGVEVFDGIPTKEPAYGLDAVWIKASQREEAAFKGYTVVNCSTIVVTHLTKIIQEFAHELLTRQDVQHLIDSVKDKSPKVIEEVLAQDGLSLGKVVHVLKNLLKEGVSIRDLSTIFESLADHCKTIQNPATLTRYVRKALGRGIIKKYLNPEGALTVASLDRSVEDLLVSGLQQQEDGASMLNIEPEIAQRLLNRIADAMGKFNQTGAMPLLLCGSQIRWDLKKIVDRFIPGLAVIAFDEIPQDIKTQNISLVTL